MDKKRFKLSPKDNTPFEIEIKDPETQTHALIRLTDGAFCDSITLAFTGKDDTATTETIDAKTFHQVDLVPYSKFSLRGIYTEAKGFLEGEIYTGNWEEIILNEVELSFSDAPFYYGCNQEQIEFSVGVEGESRMQVLVNGEGGFDVTTTIVHEAGQASVIKHFFEETSDGAQIIKRLHGRMKGRAKGAGFDERQESNKAKLTEQFNKTISESFRKA